MRVTYRLASFFANEAEVVPYRVPEQRPVVDRPGVQLPRILQRGTVPGVDEPAEALYLAVALDILVYRLEKVSNFGHYSCYSCSSSLLACCLLLK